MLEPRQEVGMMNNLERSKLESGNDIVSTSPNVSLQSGMKALLPNSPPLISKALINLSLKRLILSFVWLNRYRIHCNGVMEERLWSLCPDGEGEEDM